MVKTNCFHHKYSKDGNATLDMCSMYPEKLYGVESADCESCSYYEPIGLISSSLNNLNAIEPQG